MLKAATIKQGFPGGTVVKSQPANAGDAKRLSFDSWIRMFPCSRKWQPTPVFLRGKVHGQRSLAGYSLWGRKQLDMTEHTHYLSHTIPDPNLKKQSDICQKFQCPFSYQHISVQHSRRIQSVEDGILRDRHEPSFKSELLTIIQTLVFTSLP